MTTLKDLITEYEKNIHEVKMYIQFERRLLENYNLKYDINQLDVLFHEFENYNTQNFDKLMELRKKIEYVLSLLLSKNSADTVFSDTGINFYDDTGMNYKPLYDTLDKKVSPKNADISNFLNQPDFVEVVTHFSKNYLSLRRTIEKALLEFESESEFKNNIPENGTSTEPAGKTSDGNFKQPKYHKKTEKHTPEYITIKEAAEYLGVTKPTVYNRINKGELKIYKFGNSTRLLKQDVIASVKEQKR